MCTTEKLLSSKVLRSPEVHLRREDSVLRCSSSHSYHTGWLDWGNFSYHWAPAQVGLPTPWISPWGSATAAALSTLVLGTTSDPKSIFSLLFYLIYLISSRKPVRFSQLHLIIMFQLCAVWWELGVYHGSVSPAGFPMEVFKSFS